MARAGNAIAHRRQSECLEKVVQRFLGTLYRVFGGNLATHGQAHSKTLLGRAMRVRAVSVDEVELGVHKRVALLIRFLVALVDPRRHRSLSVARRCMRLRRVLRGTQEGQEERLDVTLGCEKVNQIRRSRQ